MATAITTAKINGFNNHVTMPTLAAVASVTLDAEVTMGADQKMLILVKNNAAAAKTATFKAGTGLQGTEDMTVSVAAGATECFTVESGKFSNKGKVVIVGESTDIQVGAIELP